MKSKRKGIALKTLASQEKNKGRVRINSLTRLNTAGLRLHSVLRIQSFLLSGNGEHKEKPRKYLDNKKRTKLGPFADLTSQLT